MDSFEAPVNTDSILCIFCISIYQPIPAPVSAPIPKLTHPTRSHNTTPADIHEKHITGAIGKAGIEPGNSVVILGAGGVGLNLIQGAALVSAHPIVAVDLSDEKLHLARQLGATHCVNAKECDLSRETTRIVGDALADVVIDSTGHVEMLEMAYQLTRTDGVTMLISGPKAGYNVSLNPEPLHFGRTVMGFQVITESRPHHQIPRYIKLANAGKLKLTELITDSASLDEINTVVEKMRDGELTGRCIIELDAN